MQIAILSGVMILGLLILIRLRQIRASSKDHRSWDRRAGFGALHPFHAISIEPAETSCRAGESIKSQRFLSDEVPSLPLAECNAVECRCMYIHHFDRRSRALDRRLGPVEESEESEFWSLRNRRSFLGRRLNEKQPAL